MCSVYWYYWQMAMVCKSLEVMKSEKSPNVSFGSVRQFILKLRGSIIIGLNDNPVGIGGSFGRLVPGSVGSATVG